MEANFKDRACMEAFLKTTIANLDNNALKTAILAMVATLPKEATVEPAAELTATVREAALSTDNEEDITKIMKEMHMDWQDAWTYIRCIELEDGASICCSEECEDHGSAIDELVYSAQIGKAKRNARRRAAGRPVSDEDTDDESNGRVDVETYKAPPRVRDADHFWPYMRCKNIVRELMRDKKIPTSHYGLLEYIAKIKGVSIEALKKTNPHIYFKDDLRMAKVLNFMSRWR